MHYDDIKAVLDSELSYLKLIGIVADEDAEPDENADVTISLEEFKELHKYKLDYIGLTRDLALPIE